MALNNPGDVLLSHRATPAVPLAPKCLTTEFGMGSGVATSRSSPETLGCSVTATFLWESASEGVLLRFDASDCARCLAKYRIGLDDPNPACEVSNGVLEM